MVPYSSQNSNTMSLSSGTELAEIVSGLKTDSFVCRWRKLKTTQSRPEWKSNPFGPKKQIIVPPT